MKHSTAVLLACVCLYLSCESTYALPPTLPDGTDAAVKRIHAFQVPAGMKVELFAAEPKLASPVAISVDERNRVYVAEEYRFNLGTEENRTRPFFLEDDLQIQTLDDRLKMYEKFASRFEGGMDWFRKVADQVRLLEDTDGDGKADQTTIFAPGFNGTLDGLAAGVMATDGDVYFTCIPNLWRLRDTDHDGVADEQTIIQTGFGVNAGFLGHDLHGLCWGPDGKLYFSVGDRGFHLTTREGQILHGPRNGAVFRCFPDGSDFEVVCRGLRNPQELAFDQFGNLFAADNNCDKGDHSRLVYCLEGSDSGWNMAFQSIPEPYLTGPWHAEKMWHLWTNEVSSADRPAWLMPPVGKLGAGPSGFTYYPGTGFPARYDHHFFMCNYTGNGGIESFSIKPRGAGFEIIDEHSFFKPISATDCEFGYDGKLYVSDFVNLLWNGGSAGGRIYTVFDPAHCSDPAVRQAGELVRAGLKSLSSERLTELLAHADQRIRQRAQFELVARGRETVRFLRATLSTSNHPLARLHALWGLGQLCGTRTPHGENAPDIRADASAALLAYLDDESDEIRAWAIKLLGDHHVMAAADAAARLLADKSPRVRCFAAFAAGKLKYDLFPPQLISLIQENGDADPWIRHACVMAVAGLLKTDHDPRFRALQFHKSPSVRMAALLAERHLYRSQVDWTVPSKDQPGPANSIRETCGVNMQRFLFDEDPRIVTEASRAINDLPLPESLPTLASLSAMIKGSPASMPDALSRRIINANFRLGKAEHAERLVSLAVEPTLSLAIRREALGALIDWGNPPPRDRVTGFWQPVEERPPEVMARVKSLFAESVGILLGQGAPELQPEIIKWIARYELPTDEAVFAGWIADATRSPATQIVALRLLTSRKSPLALSAIDTAQKSDQPAVRAEARDMLAQLKPIDAVAPLASILNDDRATTVERQRAVMTLASLKVENADSILKTWVDRLDHDAVPDFLQLDVFDALLLRDLPEWKQVAERFQARIAAADLLMRHRISLNGGNADRGRELFVGHRVGQCLRCHKVGTSFSGGNAGPDLGQVAVRHDRLALLESLIDPSAKIAKGFESVTLVMQDGRIVGGIIRREDPQEVVVEMPDGNQVTLKAAEIDERSKPKSAMPEMTRTFSPRELRDLVEFLSQLK